MYSHRHEHDAIERIELHSKIIAYLGWFIVAVIVMLLVMGMVHAWSH